MLTNHKTKQILICLFLLCFVFIFEISAQSPSVQQRINQARLNYDNGNFSRSIEDAKAAVEEAKKLSGKLLITDSLEVLASAQISLQEYEEAEKSLDEALQNITDAKADTIQKARIYLRFSSLRRSERKFVQSFDYSKKAILLMPGNQQILAEHYLNFGRILYASGYDLSAIIWLERAEKLLEKEKTTSAKLDVYRFLTLAWWAKLNYQTALQYARKWETVAENTQFKQKYRQALFDSSTILSESGQQATALRTLEKGLKLAMANDDFYQAGTFLTSLLLNSLDNGDAVKASAYLGQLEKVNRNDSFSFEVLLGRAIIVAYANDNEKSRLIFSQLEKMENSSEFILPGWKVKIAKRNKDWQGLVAWNQKLLDLTVQNNFRDELPAIYSDFAKAYFHLNQPQASEEYLRKSLALIEEIRKSENYNLSLGLSENYHDAYRLLAQIKFENSQESFELADFLKARILKDRIDNAAIKYQSVISPATRKTLEDLSLKYIDDQNFAGEIEKNEKLLTVTVPELNLAKLDLTELDKVSDFDDAAIVSYFFTLDKKLLAFVKEKGQPVRTVSLIVSEDEINDLAKTTEQKVKNFIFFKRDGKEIYDKLLKPLNLGATRHLVIVPDKSLWKVPFQALSADGEKYLIEDKLISYAPSVSILLEELKKPKPIRQSLQAYANSSSEDRVLQFVNAEASSVSGIYGSKPILGATILDFARTSDKTDILHFSMHAQVDKEQPLNSFLGFRKFGADDGRLTTEELLNIKLKKGSLAFLASCDTNNVLSGEGLVSLAWGMIGSGATTVVAAQWEANDKSTEIFTRAFYTQYKQGGSSAEALQKASLELIKDKSNNMHEPYYWADFTLNGDYR